MHLMKNRSIADRGASEIIGAVMLISVVVLAVSIIGVALTSQGTPRNSRQSVRSSRLTILIFRFITMAGIP